MGDGRAQRRVPAGLELEAANDMSKDNNVNPGQYKLRGRLRQDDAGRVEDGKAKASIAEQKLRNQSRRPKAKKD